MPLYLIVCSLFFIHGKSPVTWNTSAQKISTDEYELVFTATIEDGWNIYSQYLASDDGPVRTTIAYDAPDLFQMIGKNAETGDIKKTMDDMFGMEVIKIKHKGVFTQKIKIKDISKPITGNIEYMCCNDAQCLPPRQVPFSIDLSKMIN
ncbi:MAG: sugar transporter [Saprospiraceae bacterium]|jgi:thiol:disulfide interchange protein DsbD|nr:sugar transporter [Saprospiraceae bacterium]MBK6814658.1 sugar transporter [Saprospiraceae bacterium]MBK7370044.1 sugar transporter [Saprospiraceae bacterium]MBK7437749.1 sugar transporter [Saprospiraceae bacterium]MBK7606867.1 sugar transporter [Saprospiraceae bacterium]